MANGRSERIQGAIDNAREEYFNWLSDEYMLLPRRILNEHTLRMGYNAIKLYLYIADEIMNDRCLMDDNGDAYLLVTLDEIREFLCHTNKISTSQVLNALKDRGLIDLKRHGNGQLYSPAAIKIYLMDLETGNRIKVF